MQQAPRTSTHDAHVQKKGASDPRNPDASRKIEAQCLSFKDDAEEQEILAFTEAAAGTIRGWR
jgi:hypothetical protein